MVAVDSGLAHDLDGDRARAADRRVRRTDHDDEPLVLVVRAQVVDPHLQRRALPRPDLQPGLGLLRQLEQRDLPIQVLRLVEKSHLDRPRPGQRVDEGLGRGLVEEPQREGDGRTGDVDDLNVHPIRVAAHIFEPRERSRLHAPLEAVLPALVLRRADRRDPHRRRARHLCKPTAPTLPHADRPDQTRQTGGLSQKRAFLSARPPRLTAPIRRPP
mmetsp:Transcript_9764/g.31330  ORF Transcript_9764/g.31330 Transcript_9764/m.31330 type:complete len:215 (+) Transcript_9764:1535-2179(+)